MRSDGRLQFPRVPHGWYYLCAARDLRGGPVGLEVGPRKYVGFVGADGAATVLDARCAHMGADLSRGRATGGILHCPLHDWQYDLRGDCVRIPASDQIPTFARQTAFPAAEIGGHVVFFNRPAADFSMPFYPGVAPADLLPAEPFEFVVSTPWYMVGANAFDLQHFRIAHDRTLVDTPIIDTPSPFSRRITATYDVTGSGWRDRLTRRFSGPRVRMSITVWAGTNILVTAEFARTTSYGMVFVRPLADGRTHMRTIVWVSRRRSSIARVLFDPLDAMIRRSFIRAFMADDAVRSDGVRYNPATLIDPADHELASYFDWLLSISTHNSDGDGGPDDAEHGSCRRDVRLTGGADADLERSGDAVVRHDRRPDASDHATA
jgi:phenylpropionate dioxygenase-like ring-hydroxylating dioxygenase large terminal subunit